MFRKFLLSAVLVALAASPAMAGTTTVYPAGSHPLILRRWCFHATLTGFVAPNSTGKRTIGPVMEAGFSPLRWGPLRFPVVQVGFGEADQSQERLFNKTALLGSGGIALRTANYDNGRFEMQFHVAYTRDFTSERSGFTVGFGLGF